MDYKPFLTTDKNGERNDKNSYNEILDRNRIKIAEGVLDRHESMIKQLLGDDSNLTETTDSAVAYMKQVPANALNYAELLNVGGMCKKCENLYNKTQTPVTGTTYQCRLEAGTYTISLKIKTAGKNAYVSLYKSGQSSAILQVGFVGGYDASSSYTGIASSTFTLTEAVDGMAFYNSVNGVDVTDIMLVKGSTAKPYEPYFEGIKTAPVTKVVSKGFNLWDEEWEIGDIRSQDGTNVSDNTRIRSKNYISVKPNNEYYVKSPSTVGLRFYDINKNYLGNLAQDGVGSGNNYVIKTPANAYYFRFVVVNVTTYNHDICINVSNASLNGTYMPYRAPIEYPIPAEVQALEGYGWGFDADCNNYASYERKKNVKMVARLNLGSPNWYRVSAADRFTIAYDINASSNMSNRLCEGKYTVVGLSDNLHMASGTIQVRASKIFICDDSYDSVETFKAALDGLYLYYELPESVETDISGYIDSDYIEVEGGGTVIFENTNEIDVPSEIVYLEEVSE